MYLKLEMLPCTTFQVQVPLNISVHPVVYGSDNLAVYVVHAWCAKLPIITGA